MTLVKRHRIVVSAACTGTEATELFVRTTSSKSPLRQDLTSRPYAAQKSHLSVLELIAVTEHIENAKRNGHVYHKTTLLRYANPVADEGPF